MRLFQAHTIYGDDNSPPPPPPFSVEREATKIMPIYLNQYRDGRQRLPTPEKVAVMELSNSFERRRLGKHQQILNDISQRCREQEVSEMSGQLTIKVNLKKIDTGRPGKEVTFYSTTFMDSKNRNGSIFPEEPADFDKTFSPRDCEIGRPTFEKNYKHFPARRIMRQHTKFDFLKQPPSLPKFNFQIPKYSSREHHDMRAKLNQNQQINGPIQLEHYTNAKSDLAPLILPNLDNIYRGVQSERLDRTDTFFSANRVTLGPRTKTCLSQTLDSTRIIPAPLQHPIHSMGKYNGPEMSNLQLTSGHSPPPNSVLDTEAAMA